MKYSLFLDGREVSLSLPDTINISDIEIIKTLYSISLLDEKLIFIKDEAPVSLPEVERVLEADYGTKGSVSLKTTAKILLNLPITKTLTEAEELARISSITSEIERNVEIKKLAQKWGCDKTVITTKLKNEIREQTKDDLSSAGVRIDIPSSEIINIPQLFEDINNNYFLKYIHFDQKEKSIAALMYAANTWFAPHTSYCPMAHIKAATKGCGKTELMYMMGNFSRRAYSCVGISSATVTHVMDQTDPTLLIDEADARIKNDEGYREILDAGVDRRASRTICEKDSQGNFHTVQKICYGPKILAGIGPLPDTIEDRSVTFCLFKCPSSIVMPFPDELIEDEMCASKLKEMQSKIAAFAEQNIEAYKDIDRRIRSGEIVIPARLFHGRIRQVWLPLLKVALLGGQKWFDKMVEAANCILNEKEEAEPADYNLRLLKDIHTMLHSDPDYISSTYLTSEFIVEKLTKYSDSYWNEFGKGPAGSKPLNPVSLASIIRKFQRPKSRVYKTRIAPNTVVDGIKNVNSRLLRVYEVSSLETLYNENF